MLGPGVQGFRVDVWSLAIGMWPLLVVSGCFYRYWVRFFEREFLFACGGSGLQLPEKSLWQH